MSQTPVNIEELIDKRMKEISERLEAEQQEKEAAEQRKDMKPSSKPGTSKDTWTGSSASKKIKPTKTERLMRNCKRTQKRKLMPNRRRITDERN